MTFSEWQDAALQLIPGSMVYTVDLKRMFRQGLEPGAAIQLARNNGEVHKRGSATAPAPVVYPNRMGRPKLVGAKRKPTLTMEAVQARLASAAFAVLTEALTHRLEPDVLDYVRRMKQQLGER